MKNNPKVVVFYKNGIDSDAYIEHFSNKILKNIDKRIDTNAVDQSREFTGERNAKKTIDVHEVVI